MRFGGVTYEAFVNSYFETINNMSHIKTEDESSLFRQYGLFINKYISGLNHPLDLYSITNLVTLRVLGHKLNIQISKNQHADFKYRIDIGKLVTPNVKSFNFQINLN